MRFTKASWLVQLVSRDPKSSPFKTCLRGCSFCKIFGSGFLQFFGSGSNQGLDFLEIHPLKKINLGLNRYGLGRKKFLCKKIFKIPNFAKTLISSGGRRERASPCERCSIHAISDIMLRFHILSQISLVFNPISHQQHMHNH